MISGVLPISRLSFVMMLARKPFQIAILHVAAVGAQMRGDAARAGSLAEARRRDRIGFGVLRVGHRRVTRLPERGHVIDVNAELQGSHRLQ